MVQQLGAQAAFSENLSWVQLAMHTWQLQTFGNSSCRGSDALFWPPQARHAGGAQTYVQIKQLWTRNNRFLIYTKLQKRIKGNSFECSILTFTQDLQICHVCLDAINQAIPQILSDWEEAQCLQAENINLDIAV